MYFKTSTRLVTLKFLGLFGGNHIVGDDKVKGDEQNRNDLLYNRLDKEKLPQAQSSDFNDSITKSSKKIMGMMVELGIPGMTIGVSRRGRLVWEGAFGFCDVENQIQCEPDAKMRIASISKSLFAATMVGPMIDQNNIDLKSSVHKYLTLDEFPKQNYQGQEVDINIEQLLSHTSGIKLYSQDKGDDNKTKKARPIGSKGGLWAMQSDEQYNREHFYQRKTFRNVIDALEPFKQGPLVKNPGEYNYTTYGYTLLSAVVERIHQKTNDKCKGDQIEDVWVKTMRRDWGMTETSLDQDEPILSKRAKYYLRAGLKGNLINAPYADNSVKWAGGGIVSTTEDLVKFGNQLIDSFKGREGSRLKKETVELLWREVKQSYGLGFKIIDLKSVDGEKLAVGHLGGAVGASSILLMFPESEIVVAILVNLDDVNLQDLAIFVAKQFAK